MKQNNSPESNWQPCAPGTLSQFAGRERQRQRQRILVQATAALSVLFLCVATGYWAWQSSQRAEPRLGGLLCAEVQQNMSGYVMNQLNPELMGQMRAHLAECPMCQKMFQQMQPEATHNVSFRSRNHACQCLHCRSFTNTVANSPAKAIAPPALQLAQAE